MKDLGHNKIFFNGVNIMDRPCVFSKFLPIITALSLAMLVLASTAAADDWKSYGGTKHYEYEYNADAITYPADDIVQVWSKDTVRGKDGVAYTIRERKKAEIPTEGYEKYLYTVHLIEFKCSTRQNRLLAQHDYDTETTALYSGEFPWSEWTNIIPGTQGDLLFKVVCAPGSSAAP